MARRTALFSPTLLLAFAACSSPSEKVGDPSGTATGNAAPVASVGAVPTPNEHIAHALPRGGESNVTVRTLPFAACSLRGAHEAPKPGENLSVFADDDGIARFHIQHADPATEHVELALDCKDEQGHSLTHEIDVTVSNDAVSQDREPFRRAGRPTLPHLDVDPMSLTREELEAKGYPPRPDPKRMPEQYASWLNVVDSGATIVDSHRVADPNEHAHGATKSTVENNGPTGNSIWSGYVIQTLPNESQFDQVYGQIQVPTIQTSATHPALNNAEYSSIWVGLDGYNTDNVVQDGTQNNAQNNGGVVSTSHFAWTEWWPLGTQAISSFPAKPGDLIQVWTDVVQKSFATATEWISAYFGGSQGTLLADMNGDGKADAVAFNGTSTWVALSTGSGFATATEWSNVYFGGSNATLLADMNGDGKADAVAFNGSSTWVALSTGSGFQTSQEWTTAYFGGSEATLLADMNGDGKADAVAFNGSSTYVMLSTGSGFQTSQEWTSAYFGGSKATLLADMNGDHMADAVAFNGATTWVMLSTGSGFQTSQEWTTAYFGGSVATELADVSGDGRADAVAFNGSSTYAMLSQTTGSFYLYNLTENVTSSSVTTNQPVNTIFSGHQAEWIMEWPGNGAGDGLANYGSNALKGAEAFEFNGVTYAPLTAADAVQVWMYDSKSNDLLSEAVIRQETTNEIDFTWVNWN
jgi:hypothetical protein